MRKKRMIYTAFLSVFFLFSSCGVKFLYNQLDTIIPWMINDYMSPNTYQQAILDTRLIEILMWHRKTQLPRYVEALNELVADLRTGGVTREKLDDAEEWMTNFLDDFVLYIMPDVIEYLSLSTDTQIEELFAKLDKNNEEFAKDNVEASYEERIHKWIDRFNRGLSMFTGGFTEEQDILLENWARDLKEVGRDEYKERVKWQQQFKRVLEKRDNRTVFEEEMKALIDYNDRNRTQEYQEKIDYNKEITKDFFFQFSNTLADNQREKLINKLEKLIQDLDELSKEE